MLKINNNNIGGTYEVPPINNNILVTSNIKLSSKNYEIGGYNYAVIPQVGKTYTLTVCYKTIIGN